MTKRKLAWGTGVLVLAALAYAGIRYRASAHPEFTLRQVETLRPYDGSRQADRVELVIARRADGAVYSSEVSGAKGKTCTTASLQLPEERRWIAMELSVNRKSTFPVTRQIAEGWQARGQLSDCSARLNAETARLVGSFHVSGYEVQRFMVETPSQTLETNMAPRLGCVSLRDVRKLKDAQGRYRQENRRETLDITLGSPDPALFNIPRGLVESRPSLARSARWEYLTGSPAPAEADWAEFNAIMDARYAAAQANVRE